MTPRASYDFYNQVSHNVVENLQSRNQQNYQIFQVSYQYNYFWILFYYWSGHCTKAVKKAKPVNREIKFFEIPKGTTGKIQPLDVFGFRIWKNFVRHFSDSVIFMNSDVNLHLRNNIIKLQCLVHNQSCSSWYINIFISVIRNLKNLIILLNLALEVLKHIVKYLVVKM